MSMGNEEKQKEGRDLYNKLSEEKPERKVEKADETKTLEEEEAGESGLSDLQVALRRLFPELGDKVDNAMMFARVAPDMFIPLLRIMVNAEIKRANPKKPLNVAEIASKFYVLASIGLDGKGRVDTIELAGSVKESEELAELAKSFG